MLEIADWLSDVQGLAHQFYHEGAEYFAHDSHLSELVRQMRNDAAHRYAVLAEAEELLRSECSEIKAMISLDDETKNRILAVFEANLEKMHANSLTAMEMYDCLTKTEFSEWNDIFLYFVGTAFRYTNKLEIVTLKMRKHLDFLEGFFIGDAKRKEHYERLRGLSVVWKHKMLIADNDKNSLNLLSSVLSKRYGPVDIAKNGPEAIAKCDENYYDAIIVDVDMVGMNGLDFCSKLLETPQIDAATIITMSDHAPPATVMDRGLRFVAKPFYLRAMLEEVDRIVDREPV